LILEIPLNFAQCLMIVLILYWSIDLQGRFLIYLGALFGLFMACNSVAIVLGSVLTDVKTVSEIGPLMYIPQILFAGFFIRTSSIPIFLRWAQWLCSLKYAVNLILLTEFALHNPSCNTSDAAYENCKGVLDDNSINPNQFYVSIIMLAALTVAFRTVGPMILAYKARKYY
jgi:ABC-type multidrug transport system permease subunit